jgi:archaemetzincin
MYRPHVAGVVAALALAATAATAHAGEPSKIQVCLQPLGTHDARLLEQVGRGIEHLYGFRVATLDARPLPDSAYHAPRKRYKADLLLDFLDAEVVPADASCTFVLGFTSVDVSTYKDADHPDWGVLGLARIGGPSGVVSSFRMQRKARRTTVIRRAVKVVNHELGHVLGLDHDDREAGCVMNDARGTVKTVDGETGVLCAHERDAIEAAHGVDLPDLDALDWAWISQR